VLKRCCKTNVIVYLVAVLSLYYLLLALQVATVFVLVENLPLTLNYFIAYLSFVIADRVLTLGLTMFWIF